MRLSHLLCTPYPQALGVVVLSGLGRETGLALGGLSLESHQGQSWGWEILKLAADPQMGMEGPWCMSQCEEAGREMQASWGSRVLEVSPPTLQVRRIQRSHSAQLGSLGAVSKQQTGPVASSRRGSFLTHPPGDPRPWHRWGRAQPISDMPGPTAGGEEALERGMCTPALCSLWGTDQSARGSQIARRS